MKHIAADRQLFEELRVRGLGDVGVAVVFPVADRVVVHRLFQRRGDPHIIHDKAARLVAEYAVHAGDGLHQIVAAHGLVNIHRRQRRHVEARQPHIHHDSDFQRTAVVLENLGQLVPAAFVADDLAPFLRVFVALGHHHGDLFGPIGAKLQNPLVNLHRNGAGIGHDHRLARQEIGAEIFIVV